MDAGSTSLVTGKQLIESQRGACGYEHKVDQERVEYLPPCSATPLAIAATGDDAAAA